MPDIVTDSTLTLRPAPERVERARSGYAAWREARRRAVASPTGNLSLIDTSWYADGEQPSLDEALVSRPSTVTATELERRNIDTGAIERGVRLWDAASPAIRNFETITAFDFDASWVIEAEFVPVAGDRVIPFEHIRDNGGTRELVVPGDINVTVRGQQFTLSAFDDGGVLLLVFADATNGIEGAGGSYESGRFLFVERSDGGAFGDAGRVLLDFNRAFIPPCGFSVHYNCPLPPRNNRFPFAVTAGEKRVVFRDGYTAH
jgi:uncharacterized protein (DUF1684 family)